MKLWHEMKISYCWTVRYFVKYMVVYKSIINSQPDVCEIHYLKYMFIMLVHLIMSIISSIKITDYFVSHIYRFASSYKQIFIISPHLNKLFGHHRFSTTLVRSIPQLDIYECIWNHQYVFVVTWFNEFIFPKSGGENK